MIDGMIKRIKDDVKNPELVVILTGGHSKIIYPLTKEKIINDETLILKGLLILLAKNE